MLPPTQSVQKNRYDSLLESLGERLLKDLKEKLKKTGYKKNLEEEGRPRHENSQREKEGQNK